MSASDSPLKAPALKRGSSSGTYRPPSPASPRITASMRPTDSPPRVLRYRIEAIDRSAALAADHAAEAQKVGEDAGRRHGGTGPGASNDQRVVAVTARHELNDVVGQADVGERVRWREALETHGGAARAHVDIGDVAEHLPAALRFLHALEHRPIEVGEALQELVDGSLRERGRRKALDLDVGEL